MKNLFKSLLPLVAVVVVALMMAAPANAQCFGGADYLSNGYGFGIGGGPYGFGFGGFGGGFYSPYRSRRIPTPPYFALHPPVYYSAPVARSYGYSPFAYPGTVQTPAVAPMAVTPQMIQNPYVQPVSTDEAKTEPTNDSVQAKPLMIVNPYVSTEPATAVELATVEYGEK